MVDCMNPMTEEQMLVCMQMTMSFKPSICSYLFDSWQSRTPGAYFGTLLFVALLCLIVEATPFIRSMHISHHKPHAYYSYDGLMLESQTQ